MWCNHVADALDNLETERTQLISDNPDDNEARQRAIASIRKDAHETLRNLRNHDFRTSKLAPHLHRANNRTRALLIERVEREFKDLEDPINEWLSILGPSGTPRIEFGLVQTAHRPSLELRVGGYDHINERPHVTGHFSDAQIDMLGMSAHLARIERDHPGATIVIDDPSDMLDSHSRKALAAEGIGRLLDSQSGPAHQVVILTHDDQLVQELWDAHRHRIPAMVQDTIESTISEPDEDTYSILTSRTADSAVARAKELVDLHWNMNQDRIWFRSALAAHTRQAAEMCAKDISTLLGPIGLNITPPDRVVGESEDLGNVSTAIRADLREISASWCDHGRHIPARKSIDMLLDLFSSQTSRHLNPGAHADVILPESTSTKSTLDSLKNVVPLLAAPDGRPRSAWTTESLLAQHLRSGEQCPGCQEKS